METGRRHSLCKHLRGVRWLAVAVAVLSCVFFADARAAWDRPKFDKLVSKAMERWAVPGLAIAAIKDGKVVHLKAYGLAVPEAQLPATTETMFAIGSITKSFTSTLMVMLADEGILDLDRPINGYLPDFRFMDQKMTESITARDLLSHRTGMPRHDVLWYAGAFGRGEMVRRVRYLKPTARPRVAFQYNNLMYMVAGHMAGRVTRTTWEDQVRRRILKPLGMNATRMAFLRFLSSGAPAIGYFGKGVMRVPIPPRNTDPIGPAAAVYSTIEDMARYLRFHMNGGVVRGARLISPGRMAELRTPHIDVRRQGRWLELGDVAYGLGFYVSSYRSRRVVYHTGFIDGYGGMLSFMPEHKVGMVILSNLSGHNPVPKILANLLYDRLLDVEPIPWLDRYIVRDEARGLIVATPEQKKAGQQAAVEEEMLGGEEDSLELDLWRLPPPAPEPARRRPPAPPVFRPAKAYEGIYDHPGYGPIQIWAEGSLLIGRFHYKIFPMERVKDDLWQAADTVWPIREGLRIRFKPGRKGRMASLLTPIADGPTYRYKVGNIEFRRIVPDKTKP